MVYSAAREFAYVISPPKNMESKERKLMPVTLLYGHERARVARLALSLLRTVRNAYTPDLTLAEASEFLFLMMHLFIGHAQGKPLSASRLARIAEMPRTTVLRRLAMLIELGYLERIGNRYYLTAKSNVPYQRRVLLEHISNIQHTAKELSKMDTLRLARIPGAR
jgi:IclR helix-turn-helix domain